jgi:Trypsin-like peptidase domain
MESPNYVVQVFGKKRNGQPYHGTGFFLNPQGDVATCWHVIKNNREIFVQVPYLAMKWAYRVLANSREEDVAILQIKVPPGKKPAYATLYPEWFTTDGIGTENVLIVGYADNENTDFANQMLGNISGVMNEHGLIVVHTNLNKGDSGAPVLNAQGHVIGIANYKRKSQAMVRPISRLCELLKEKGIKFTGPEGSGDLVGQAINSLPELMRERPVHKAVKEYREVFKRSSRHVSTLHAYKKAHELLYGLELDCYNSLVSDARHFPHKKQARDKVLGHLVRLEDYVSDAEGIVSYVKGDQLVETMCAQLKRAYAELQKAHSKHDVRHCKAALALLEQLVSLTLSKFNTLLRHVVKELDIHRLVAALQSVQKEIPSAELSATAGVFQLGVNDLVTLGRDLHRLMSEHNQWQRLDDALRLINRNSPRLLIQLEAHWPIITPEIEAVCNLAPASLGEAPGAIASHWRTFIEQETISLDNAQTAGDSKKASIHFRNLRDHAAQRFDRTDYKLLETCAKISRLKEPLQTVVDNL